MRLNSPTTRQKETEGKQQRRRENKEAVPWKPSWKRHGGSRQRCKQWYVCWKERWRKDETSVRCSHWEAPADPGRSVFGEMGWKSHHKRSDGWGGGDGVETWVKITPLRYYRITVQWWNRRKVLPVTATSLPSLLPPLQDRAANRHTDFAVGGRTRRLARHNVSSALSKISLVIIIPSESQGTRAAWRPWKRVMPWHHIQR